MRRLFWVAVGAAAGIYAVRKVQTSLHAYSPAGLADRAGSLGGSVGATLAGFVHEVRAGMVERESELRDALGLSDAPELTPAQAVDLTEHPSLPRPAPRSVT